MRRILRCFRLAEPNHEQIRWKNFGPTTCVTSTYRGKDSQVTFRERVLRCQHLSLNRFIPGKRFKVSID